MQKITLNRTKTTVFAPYLPYTAYKAFVEGATALNAQIAPHTKGVTEATFNSVEDAKKFVTDWTANYNANRKVDLTSNATTPKQKPTASKGNSIDLNAFKGTKSEKNRALHAMLVAKGITNSKSAEYQAVWNARPWAK